jgi:predicted ATP-binding protein involved in virulence
MLQCILPLLKYYKNKRKEKKRKEEKRNEKKKKKNQVDLIFFLEKNVDVL